MAPPGLRLADDGRIVLTQPRYAEDELDLIFRTRQEEVYEEEEASGLVYTISGMLKVVEVTWSRCDWLVGIGWSFSLDD